MNYLPSHHSTRLSHVALLARSPASPCVCRVLRDTSGKWRGLHVPHQLCFFTPVCPLGRLTAGHLASRTPAGNCLHLSSTSRPKITEVIVSFHALRFCGPTKLSQGNDVRNSLSFLDYWRTYGTGVWCWAVSTWKWCCFYNCQWFVLIKSPTLMKLNETISPLEIAVLRYYLHGLSSLRCSKYRTSTKQA